MEGYSEQKRNILSCLMMVASSFFWVGGYIYSNNHNVSPIETAMIRGIVLAAGCYTICKIREEKLNFEKNSRTILIRNMMMVINCFSVAFAQFYIPLPMVHTIACTGPLFVMTMEYFLEGKTINKKQVFGIVFILSGALLIANARLISKWYDPSKEFKTQFQNYKSESPLITLVVSLGFILNMIIWAYGVFLTKKVNINSIEMNTHLGVLMVLINSVVYQGMQKHVDGPTFYWGLIFSGVCLMIAETFFVEGIKISVQTGVSLMSANVVIPVSYFYSTLFYSEQINLICVMGSVLIIIGLSRILIE